jgi:hypothetical protein
MNPTRSPNFLLPLFVSSFLHAQVARTALKGTITDEQGRLIPSAKVTAISLASGLKRKVETGIQGTYVLPDLEIGT